MKTKEYDYDRGNQMPSVVTPGKNRKFLQRLPWNLQDLPVSASAGTGGTCHPTQQDTYSETHIEKSGLPKQVCLYQKNEMALITF